MMKLKNQYHPHCIFNSDFIDLKISFSGDGELVGHFDCNKKFQGYCERIHGGIIAGIIDSAMTLFLFGHNIVAYTVRLNIKYSHPVLVEKEAVIKVKFKEKQHDCVYNITSAIYQDNNKLITSDAKFWLVKDLNRED